MQMRWITMQGLLASLLTQAELLHEAVYKLLAKLTGLEEDNAAAGHDTRDITIACAAEPATKVAEDGLEKGGRDDDVMTERPLPPQAPSAPAGVPTQQQQLGAGVTQTRRMLAPQGSRRARDGVAWGQLVRNAAAGREAITGAFTTLKQQVAAASAAGVRPACKKPKP